MISSRTSEHILSCASDEGHPVHRPGSSACPGCMAEYAGKSNQVGSISTPATNDKVTARYARPAAGHSAIFAFIGNDAYSSQRRAPGFSRAETISALAFEKHIHELSDACLLALIRFSAVDKTCRERLSRECTGVEPGQGRLESCLRSVAAKLDDYCKGALSRAIPGAGNVR